MSSLLFSSVVKIETYVRSIGQEWAAYDLKILTYLSAPKYDTCEVSLYVDYPATLVCYIDNKIGLDGVAE